jgi:hypothetical protein
MTQAPAAIFKIPTESPQLAPGKASRARKAAAAQPRVWPERWPGSCQRDPCRDPR